MVEIPQDNSSPIVMPSFRLAIPEDIGLIDNLDSFSSSPTRDIHREMEKYFGSIDPSTHERTLIFLAEVERQGAAKAELMLPPGESSGSVGYIRRVVVHPHFRQRGLAHQLLLHVVAYARRELHLANLDLHVWEQNQPAIHLYEALGFTLQHRELYFRLSL